MGSKGLAFYMIKFKAPCVFTPNNRPGLKRTMDAKPRINMKILLPTDGSEQSLNAVRYAIGLVQGGLSASFVLVNVQEPTHLYEVVMAPDAEVLQRVSGAAAKDALEDAQDLLRQAEIDFESEVLSDDPANGILEAGERHNCDAIFLGARSRGLLSSALFGSVSQAVLHRSPVPVSVVKNSPASWTSEDTD